MRTRPGQQRKAVVREAGLPGISGISILAGIVAAYGTFAVVASIAGAIAHRADTSTEFRSNDWTGSGAVALLISAVTLFIAYLFGGYIAGRMARRRGVAHGVAVFVVSIVVAAIAGGVVRAFTDNADIRRNLRSIGAPTTWNQVSGVAVVGVIVALAAMLVGAILGGALGDRWHTKLERRAADPAFGPAADPADGAGQPVEPASARDLEGRREVDPRREVDARHEPVGASVEGTRYERTDGTDGYGRGDGTDRESFDGGPGEPVEPGISGTRRDASVDQPDGRTPVGPSTGRDVRPD